MDARIWCAGGLSRSLDSGRCHPAFERRRAHAGVLAGRAHRPLCQAAPGGDAAPDQRPRHAAGRCHLVRGAGHRRLEALLTPMGGCTRVQGSSNEPRPLTAAEAALDGARPSTGAQGLAIDTSVTLPSLSLKWKRAPTALDHRSLSLSSRWKVGTSTVTVAAYRPSPSMALLAE